MIHIEAKLQTHIPTLGLHIQYDFYISIYFYYWINSLFQLILIHQPLYYQFVIILQPTLPSEQLALPMLLFNLTGNAIL